MLGHSTIAVDRWTVWHDELPWTAVDRRGPVHGPSSHSVPLCAPWCPMGCHEVPWEGRKQYSVTLQRSRLQLATPGDCVAE